MKQPRLEVETRFGRLQQPQGCSPSSEFHVSANVVEMQLVRMSGSEAPRQACEYARAKSSPGDASDRCDDDVCRLHPADI